MSLSAPSDQPNRVVSVKLTDETLCKYRHLHSMEPKHQSVQHTLSLILSTGDVAIPSSCRFMNQSEKP